MVHAGQHQRSLWLVQRLLVAGHPRICIQEFELAGTSRHAPRANLHISGAIIDGAFIAAP